MILISHVLIALGSLCYAGYTLYRPSRVKLRVSYGFIVLTILSGTYLVWNTKAHMLHACAMGLAFVLISMLGVALARRRLALVSVAVD